jgi:hypothetical protein
MRDDYIPLSQRSTAQLRAQAEQYRRMAATARMANTENSLLKLAIRLDALADQRERGGSGGGPQSE